MDGVRTTQVARSPIRILHRVYPAGFDQTMHAHEQASISLLLSGEVTERTPSSEYVAGSGSVVLKPPGIVHADRFGGSETQVLYLDLGPRRELLPGLPNGDRFNVNEWRWIDGGPLARALFGIWLAHERHPTAFDRVVKETLLSLPRLIQRVARYRSEDEAPDWLSDVRERILREYRDPPLVRELAEDAGIHPTYLTRCFKSYVGITVTGFVQRCRALEAARLIGTTNLPLAHVSLKAGFADQSHLCRVFKRETGLTPRQYRTLL